MGFLSTMKSHGASGNKNVGAKFVKTFIAVDSDADVVAEVKLRLNTIVLDTSDEGVIEDTVHGGSIATPNGTVTYKSGDSKAVAMFAESASEALDASLAKAEAKPKRRRSGKPETVEPSTNGSEVTTA